MNKPLAALASSISLALVLLLAGCAARRAANLRQIYERAAQAHGPERNPVILIPGILGSRLVADGETVWGGYLGTFADPDTPQGARLLAYPMADGVPLPQLRDQVYPDGALDRLRFRFLGVPAAARAYGNLLGTLGVGGYQDEAYGGLDYGTEHFTCFQFAYDWRRSNAETAADLDAFIQEKRAYVQREIERLYGIEDYDVQFDLVAHSMGGLAAHYFLRYGSQPLSDSLRLDWRGAEVVDKVIFVGTPHAGALDALANLIEGEQLAPLFPRYSGALLGTMPSVYQLLPRGRHGVLLDEDEQRVDDLLDLGLWTRRGWSLASDQARPLLAQLLPNLTPAQRGRVALDHLAKNLQAARQFQAALDRPSPLPDGLRFYAFAGDAIDTPSVAKLDAQGIHYKTHGPGDASVLRSSVLMDERVGGTWTPALRSPIAWTQTHFVFAEHLAMTRDPGFADNLLSILLEQP